MRIKLYLLCAAMLVCGSIVAQEHHYQVSSSFENNMTFRARVCIDGVEQQSINVIEIGAFNGDVCTDSKFVKTFGTNNYYRVNMTIGGAGAYPITFKLYNHTEGEEEEMLNYILTDPAGNVCESFMWANDGNYGSYAAPYTLNFVHSTSTLDLTITGYGEGTGKYYLIAPPFGDVDPNDVTNMIPTSGGYDLFYFDQTKENEWNNYKEGENSTNPGFNLEPGKGYLYAREEGATLTFTGTAYSGNGTFDLVYSTTNSDPIMHGWNLMGNPFATTATVNRDCYVMGEGGSEIILSENRSVEAMQGVFVKALATETEPKVTFEQGNSIGDGAKVVLNVRKDRAATIDRAMVRFNDNSSLPKFMLDNTNTKIYIPQNGDQYAVVSGSNENSLPVNFKAKENGTYTLNIDVENVDMDYLHLIDHKTGADVDLLVNPNYTFQARSTDYAERFTLVYANTTGLEENFAFFNGSKWVIGNEGKATLQIMDVVGRLLSSEQINGCTEISLGQPAGVYVMRLINGDNVKTQKVVVR